MDLLVIYNKAMEQTEKIEEGHYPPFSQADRFWNYKLTVF